LNDALWSSRPNPGPGEPRIHPHGARRIRAARRDPPNTGASSGPGQCSLLEALPLSTQGHGLGWTHPLPLRVAVATARRSVLGRVAGSRNTGLQGRRKPRRHRGSRSTATGIRSPRSGPRYSQVWLWRLKAVPPRTALDRCDRGRRYRRFTDGVDLAIGRKLRRARGERD